MFETHRQQASYIKFPPLPNAPFAISKPIKCPDWFRLITYATLANEKLAKKITITPYTYDFDTMHLISPFPLPKDFPNYTLHSSRIAVEQGIGMLSSQNCFDIFNMFHCICYI